MTGEPAPLVSIGMPVFNAKGTLGAAVRSILNQTYQNWELILIDDGSTDGTVRLAREFTDERVRVVEGVINLGLPKRLNEAVLLARGVFFARMDSDDVAYPHRLEREVEYLLSHPDVDVVGTAVIVFRGEGLPIGVRHAQGADHREICVAPQRGFKLPHPTWMGRVSWFRVHPYRVGAIGVEDQDLLLRSHLESCFACLPDILLGYREDRISVRKLLRRRCSFSTALLREVWRGGPLIYLVGIFEQVLKIMVDVFAIASGLNYKLLRHRAQPASQDEIRVWATVWIQCLGAKTEPG
jgi:glycosyltransferase involved in cell wall biosynthesis